MGLGHMSEEFKVMFEATEFWESSVYQRIFKDYNMSMGKRDKTGGKRYRTLNIVRKWSDRI